MNPADPQLKGSGQILTYKEKKDQKEQERAQLEVLEEYAAMVEGALNVESTAPFGYGGLAMHEALSHIQMSLETLEKRGEL